MMAVRQRATLAATFWLPGTFLLLFRGILAMNLLSPSVVMFVDRRGKQRQLYM